MRVTGGESDEALARITIRESAPATSMDEKLWRAVPALTDRNACNSTAPMRFSSGGGKALMNAYYAAARERGIEVLYNAEVVALRIADGTFESATVLVNGEPVEICAKTLVAAAGGFEANLDWLKEAWGDAALNFIVRGTPYNKGKVLKLLLDSWSRARGRRETVPLRCHRWARAEVRRRNRHAPRLPAAGDCGQQKRRAVLRRRRGLMAQALRDMGQAGRATAGPDRLVDH